MADPDRDGNRRRRAFLLFGLGALGALAAAWVPPLGSVLSRPRAPVAFWAADRDGERVVGLDGDLLVTGTWPVECPIDLVLAETGALWVLRADRADSAVAPRLLHLSPGGEEPFDLPLPGARALLPDGRGGVLALVEGSEAWEVWRVDPSGERSVLAAARPGALLAAGAGGILLVEGELLQLLGGVARARFPGVRVLAVEPEGEGWWLVEEGLDPRGEGERRLRRLDASLSTLLHRELADLGLPSGGSLHLTPRPRRGGIWLVHERGEALRLDSAGRVRARGGPPPPGVEDCLATLDGGVLVVAPGAIARLDFTGRVAPGQGGFHFLTALARASPSPGEW